MSGRVFDFSQDDNKDNEQENRQKSGGNITYTTYYSNEKTASAIYPILVLDNKDGFFEHHITGSFIDPEKRTCFETKEVRSDIVKIDKRFEQFIRWMGINHILVQLSGTDTEEGFAVYKIREVDNPSHSKLSAGDGFLQFMMQRLFNSQLQREALCAGDVDEDMDDDDDMKLTSLQSIRDFLDCAGKTFPSNIRSWAKRNLMVASSSEVSEEERRHAQRALSIMLNISWKSSSFEPIDPVKAREILDETIYGMEKVKQRIIETIIQINRTHRLPAYGLLLIGPAGTGKSQIAYAVAKILRLPWVTLDMSAVHDPEQLTGSSRIYANAKPGSIMEAFSKARESNLVFIINELDKADSDSAAGNPADALLTLLDNLGYTDNYMECMIPTGGVYPIATANDKSRISEPLLTRFAVIELPDYTMEEKKTIFLKFSLPKVLKRLGLMGSECVVTEDGAKEVVEHYKNVSGVRDLEQAAEHLAAHALFLIETEHVSNVTYNAEEVRKLLD